MQRLWGRTRYNLLPGLPSRHRTFYWCVCHQTQSEDVSFTASEAPGATCVPELKERTKQPCSLCVRIKWASISFLMGSKGGRRSSLLRERSGAREGAFLPRFALLESEVVLSQPKESQRNSVVLQQMPFAFAHWVMLQVSCRRVLERSPHGAEANDGAPHESAWKTSPMQWLAKAHSLALEKSRMSSLAFSYEEEMHFGDEYSRLLDFNTQNTM